MPWASLLPRHQQRGRTGRSAPVQHRLGAQRHPLPAPSGPYSCSSPSQSSFCYCFPGGGWCSSSSRQRSIPRVGAGTRGERSGRRKPSGWAPQGLNCLVTGGGSPRWKLFRTGTAVPSPPTTFLPTASAWDFGFCPLTQHFLALLFVSNTK